MAMADAPMPDAADPSDDEQTIEVAQRRIEIEDLPEQLLQDCGLTEMQRIGAGAFGTVFEAMWDPKKREELEGDSNQRERRRSDKIKIAIKVMDYNKYVFSETIPKDCDHPNIIKILDVWYNPDKNQRFHSSIIMPLCQRSLRGYMGQERAVLNVEKQHKLKTGIMRGLEYLHTHKKHIIHRDVKPCNILINDDGPHAKLADFGYSKKMDEGNSNTSSYVGTLAYMAPEILLHQPYKHHVDIWSSGKVFLFISIGEANRNAITLKNCGVVEVPEHKAIQENGDEIQNYQSKRLIMDMMMKIPSARPSATEVLQRLQNEDRSTRPSTPPPPPPPPRQPEASDTNPARHSTSRPGTQLQAISWDSSSAT